jgi:hypothetical protein
MWIVTDGSSSREGVILPLNGEKSGFAQRVESGR